LHLCLPHTRGGVSTRSREAARRPTSSPHTWGCFRPVEAAVLPGGVFPTHVGVFLRGAAWPDADRGLPHTRGGVSLSQPENSVPTKSSPHTWGCFSKGLDAEIAGRVFPTHVGVFLVFLRSPLRRQRLPHTRGGVSQVCGLAVARLMSSPHTWGCFPCLLRRRQARRVFPTHVGVFLWAAWQRIRDLGLPHTRGGVSSPSSATTSGRGSSPHTWGCFQPAQPPVRAGRVFPTHVGVFPPGFRVIGIAQSLPHTRGGVSNGYCEGILKTLSSPHTWGCFLVRDMPSSAKMVFPTHVGVFLHGNP